TSGALGALAAGSYVVNVQLSRAGRVLDDFERPFSRGGGQIAYTRKPLEERVGLGAEEKVALPRHDLSDEVVTPHVPWGNPLAGGPIKAIVLCDDFVAREVIELKQRLQMDLTYVKFRTMFWDEELYCGDRSVSTPEQANKRLLDYLKANKYDLFIISGFNWNTHFKPETRAALMEQVKAGAGLIAIEPDGVKDGEELAPILGVAKDRSMWAYSKWLPTEASPLTAGLPWDVMPPTRRMSYTSEPTGQVLATWEDGKPLLVTNKLGEGRTAVLTYDTLTHAMSYRGYAGLIPIFSYRGAFLRDDYKNMTWEYWEPYYALLARLSAWAAKRDTGVDVVSLEPLKEHRYGEKAEVLLRLKAPAGELKVMADFRNRWGEALPGAEVARHGEQAEVRIPVPATLPAGLNTVNVIVSNPAGAHVAWGQTYVRTTAPLAVKALTPEKTTVMGTRADRKGQLYDVAFALTEPLKLTVALDGLAPLQAGYSLSAKLTDTHGRLLWQETRPLGDLQEQAFTATVPELRSQGLQWQVVAAGPQGQTDVAYAKVLCVAPRDWERFKLTSWNGIFPWRSEYLNEHLAPRVEALVDVALGGGVETAAGKTWENLWHNINYAHLGLLGNMGKDVADFMEKDFAGKSAKYQQTKDKQYLVRTPSLADREWRAKVMARMEQVAKDDLALGSPYDYCMGDEMSLTHYTRYYDFDFDPRNLADFREWLKKRYASVEALNKAWDTTYATWDEVMPLTLDEAKARDNAAGWAEFREFMNDTMAGFCAEVEQNLQKVDPAARAGLSGTQEPRAGNGMDWWKMSKGFNYYHAYNTGWSNEMRRSFAPYTGVQQTPYFAGYWQAGRQIEDRMFWCLLHDTQSVSAWTTSIFFYNDFTYSESGRDTLALCEEFRKGIWDQMRTGAWQHDGIAIHYSQAAINGAQLLSKEEEHKDVRDVWVKLLEDCGLQYNFVATEQIENGLLNNPKNDFERYKVIILPESFAITAKEKAELETFVKNGGTVIADYNVGVLDRLCRKQSPGMLDSLFGLKRGGQPDTTLGLNVTVPGAEAPEVKLSAAEAITAAGATAGATSAGASKAPALLQNKVGKGQAWYLNADLRPYESERTFHSPGEKQIRVILLAIVGGAGVKPQYPVQFASGQAANVEVTRHRAGDLIYLGLQRGPGDKDELATVKLPVNWYVYDMRKGEALGKRQEVKMTFEGQQARVYCLSPEPLAAPQLTLAEPLQKAGGVVRYNVSLKNGNDNRRQVVRLTVTGPDGKEYRDYARNIILGSKPVAGSFQLALNDQPGAWKVTARDVCSGASVTQTFNVK
ncbi:MAG: beta-galactosidase trimerization domain-containing protein, partial [Armatimonadia bacterium]